MILETLSIKNKLIGIVLLVSFFAVGTGFTVVIINDLRTFKQDMVNSTVMNARLIGEYCVTPLAFDDKRGAEGILKKLQTVPNIMNGYLYDNKDVLFAVYNRTGESEFSPTTLNDDSERFSDGWLHVTSSVNYQGQKYGKIYLHAATDQLNEKITNYLTMMMFLLIVIIVFSYLLALRLQTIISQPILGLAQVASKISSHGDYSVRVKKENSDEIGTLYDSFNEMLAQIKQSEDVLREKEHIIESASSCISTTDLKGRMTYGNPAFLQKWGFANPEEFLGDQLSKYWDFSENYDALFKELHAQGQWFGELDAIRKDGSRFPVQVSAAKVLDSKGVPSGFMATSTDITLRKQTEQELQRYRNHLESLVLKRTKELEKAHRELVRKEKLSTLGQLTATVAHEIRNPLGTVRTSVFSVGDAIAQNQPARVDRALKLAERNIKRCDKIIEELLDFTRKKEFHLKSMNIDKWLNQVISEQVVPESVKRVCTLRCGAEVNIDPDQFRRAIINVMDNALQALLGAECPLLEIHVKTRITSNRLEIRITDTGPGMSPETQEKVFEPLYSTKNFGVGLGMPIVKNIMEDHRGGVEIETEPGKGTTMILWLPYSSTEEREDG